MLSEQGASPDPDRMLGILTAEHVSLTAMRSQVQAEASSRAGMFVAALTGGIVAISFIAQATGFGPESTAFALMILPVVFFLGVTTFVRTLDIAADDVRWVRALNRVRSGYVAIEPAVDGYLVTGRTDDSVGLNATLTPGRPPRPLYGLVATPGVVAVVDSSVGAAIAGIVAATVAPSAGPMAVLLVGALAFLAVITLQSLYGIGVFARAVPTDKSPADWVGGITSGPSGTRDNRERER
jgi:hypothetical protein